MRFIDQIVVKRPNRRDFSRSGRGIQAVVGHVAVLMLHAVTAQIGHVGVDIGQCYFFHKVEIDIHDGNFTQREVAQRRATASDSEKSCAGRESIRRLFSASGL